MGLDRAASGIMGAAIAIASALLVIAAHGSPHGPSASPGDAGTGFPTRTSPCRAGHLRAALAPHRVRRGELLGLTWRGLKLDRARLQVTQQLIPTKGGCTFGPPKSKRGERTVALDAVTIEALEHHRAVQLLERDVAGPAYEDGDLVFCDEIGQPIIPQRLTDAFGRFRKAAGIPTGSLHILRHTAVTLALTATPPVPLHVVAARIGDDAKTVRGTYSHLLPTSDEAAADVIAGALAEAPVYKALTNPSLAHGLAPTNRPVRQTSLF
jgi:integrase